MSLRGQRFELDLDAPNFSANVHDTDPSEEFSNSTFVVKEIREHETDAVPAAPKQRSSSTGFPERRARRPASAFKHLREQQKSEDADNGIKNVVNSDITQSRIPTEALPSDRAILHHAGKKYGYDFEAQQKAEISEESQRRIATMSADDIEEARRELMQSLNPALIERLMKRAKVEEGGQAAHDFEPTSGQEQSENESAAYRKDDEGDVHHTTSSVQEQGGAESAASPKDEEANVHQMNDARVHFPVPPRSRADYVPLDPTDPNFHRDLKTHYFPDTPHNPSSMSWLQDPTDEENTESSYNPTRTSYAPSSVRFGFTGKLIPPKESLEIDVSRGLHHHGEAPSSAGYTIPELAILARSTMPSQRSIAYQITGRVLYRLGRGDYGSKGTDLHDGLWDVVEKERIIEIMMIEADRAKGHVTAKAYAVEALWLWRKGGGGERGVLKPGQTRVP